MQVSDSLVGRGTVFIQVIEGRVRDAEAMRERLEVWRRDLMGGAAGYLGSTHGITADRTWISVVEFDSHEAAQRNSGRPEQDAWWTATSKLFEGDVQIDDSADVDVVVAPVREPGFVQVLRGRSNDKDRLRALLKEIAPIARDGRPHLLGAVYAWHGERFTNTVYFTTEDDARAGERRPPPPHMTRWLELVDDLRFLDLPNPLRIGP